MGWKTIKCNFPGWVEYLSGVNEREEWQEQLYCVAGTIVMSNCTGWEGLLSRLFVLSGLEDCQKQLYRVGGTVVRSNCAGWVFQLGLSRVFVLSGRGRWSGAILLCGRVVCQYTFVICMRDYSQLSFLESSRKKFSFQRSREIYNIIYLPSMIQK